MDVNQTHYHLVSGEADWLPVLVDNPESRLWWEPKSQNVLLAPQVLHLPTPATSAALKVEHRRGASFDHYGNAYWIDELEKAIRYQPSATPDQAGPFWSVSQLQSAPSADCTPGEFQPAAAAKAAHDPILRGLAVTAHEYLVVGTHQPAGLLVFDLHGGGPPSWLLWPESVPFAPFDMTPAIDGGLWILDRGVGPANARCWRLDRFFRVMPCSDLFDEIEPATTPIFHPVGEESRQVPARLFPAGIDLDLSSPVAIDDPLAIEGLSDGSVLIMENDADADFSVIHYLRNGQSVDSVSLDEQVIGKLLAEPFIRGHDMVFLPSVNAADTSTQGVLYVSAANGTQVFQFLVRAISERLKLTLQPILLPMRGHSGKALAGFNGEVFYDFGERWLPLTEQPRRRFTSQGELEGLIKDGKEPDCVWHRIMVDASIPEGTRVAVQSRVANHKELLAGEAWHDEPALYLRSEGSEIPLHQPFGSTQACAATTGTWELLLQNAVGRYIELRMVLYGTGCTTPRIQSLRIYYPRFSYLKHYLPAVYRDDASSGSFLDRFLSNAEGIFTTLEGRIECIEALFDTRTAPGEYLTWLAGWLGAVDDPTWDDRRRRLFVAHAQLLYRWRGTQIGMRAAIRLASDECPDESIFDELKDQKEYRLGTLGGHHVRIVEQFLVRSHPKITLGDAAETTQLGFSDAQEPWEPSHGPYALHQKFQRYLAWVYNDSTGAQTVIQRIRQSWGSAPETLDQIQFPPIVPESEAQARDWMRFSRDVIGFTYAAVTDEDTPLFQEFLARRYHRIDLLNRAYQRFDENRYHAFSDVSLPGRLPSVIKALADWIEFVSLAVPIQRNAHRFKVLVPTRLGELPQSRERRKAQVEEIVQQEKPAHTDFEVGMYWALFQIGSARLGLDTTIGEGSRFAALVLGENYLGQAFLSASHPWCVEDRTVAGRDRLTRDYTWRV